MIKVGDEVRFNDRGVGYLKFVQHITFDKYSKKSAARVLKEQVYKVSSVEKPIQVSGRTVYEVGLEDDNGVARFVNYKIDTDHLTTEIIRMTKKEEVKMPWEGKAAEKFAEDEAQVKRNPITVLLDGDIVAYRVAAAADGRHYTIKGVVENTNRKELKRFRYKKEANKYADQHSLPTSDIELAFDPEPWDKAVLSVDSMIATIKESYRQRGFEPDVYTFITGESNFRYELFPDYKKSRKNIRRPEHLKKCKVHLVGKHNAVGASGLEADDLIGMATEKLMVGWDEVNGSMAVSIASVDKDFVTLLRHGVELYDFTTESATTLTPREAMVYFYKQLLIGDTSDDIPGIKGVGPQTAIKVLKGCNTDGEMCKAVLAEYQSRMDLTDEETVKLVLRNGRLLHLTREFGKLWEIPPAALNAPSTI